MHFYNARTLEFSCLISLLSFSVCSVLGSRFVTFKQATATCFATFFFVANHSISISGKIVLTENPEMEVASFTQAQVNHHKVAYQPPDTELGIVSRSMRFIFSVSDEAGNKLPDQVFVLLSFVARFVFVLLSFVARFVFVTSYHVRVINKFLR